MSYRTLLNELIAHYIFEPWDDITRDAIEANFRAQIPGPYKVVWHKELDENHMPQFELEFEDDKEATAWYLRWS